jgi:hypothetical protein
VHRLELQLPAVDDAIAVPRSALYGNDHVYRVSEGRLERVRVERLGESRGESQGELRGDDRGSRLLLRSDALRPGDRIATTQLPNAVDGLRVRWDDAGTSEPQE